MRWLGVYYLILHDLSLPQHCWSGLVTQHWHIHVSIVGDVSHCLVYNAQTNHRLPCPCSVAAITRALRCRKWRAVLVRKVLNHIKKTTHKRELVLKKEMTRLHTIPPSIHNASVDTRTLTSDHVSWHELGIPIDSSISARRLEIAEIIRHTAFDFMPSCC